MDLLKPPLSPELCRDRSLPQGTGKYPCHPPHKIGFDQLNWYTSSIISTSPYLRKNRAPVILYLTSMLITSGCSPMNNIGDLLSVRTTSRARLHSPCGVAGFYYYFFYWCSSYDIKRTHRIPIQYMFELDQPIDKWARFCLFSKLESEILLDGKRIMNWINRPISVGFANLFFLLFFFQMWYGERISWWWRLSE